MNLFGEDTRIYLLTAPDVDYAVKVEAVNEWALFLVMHELAIPDHWKYYTRPENPAVSGKTVVGVDKYKETKNE